MRQVKKKAAVPEGGVGVKQRRCGSEAEEAASQSSSR